MTEPTRIRVYLVDDHEIVRRGLRAFLETADDVTVVGETADGRQAVSEIAGFAEAGEPVDVVLTDLVMPAVGGFELAHRILGLPDPPRVVILSAYGDSDRVRRALDLEISGYVMKSSRPDNILSAVRAAANGELYVDPSVTIRLVQSAETSRSAPALTRREHEVVALVAEGKSNLDIAASLFISERTARTHVSHILSKLGYSSRVQLALWALESRGIGTPEQHD